MRITVTPSSATRSARRSLLAVALVAVIGASPQAVSAQHVPELAPPGMPANTPLKPTPKSFGKPAPFAMPASPFNFGPFLCWPGYQQCQVRGAQILNQMDPGMASPLREYVKSKYSKDGGPVGWSEPQLGGTPSVKSVAQFAGDIQGYGCYITTITMMENAALANLPPNTVLSGRTKDFANIASDASHGFDLDRSRLLWQYERWADKLQPNKEHPNQVSSPDFLEPKEFTQGIPGATYDYVNSPTFDKYSDDKLVKLLKAGHYLGFAYSRWTVGRNDPNGKPVVGFTITSQHKVDVSGFDTTQVYPISIADVGNGQPYQVRIARLRDLSYSLKGVPAGTSIPVTAKYADRLAVIYKGTKDVFDEGSQVYMLDGVMDMTVPVRWSRVAP